MPRISAGLLMYRRRPEGLQVLLVHPGGPFWKNKDAGAWTIPKGETGANEELLDTALREFEEEIGVKPTGSMTPLTPIKQKAGKIVHAWAVEGDLDTQAVKSNEFRMEWPAKSGKFATFPEIDHAEFFDLPTARTKINSAQVALLDELASIVKETGP
jgi:predicted NUDIX family NTP pyrophosphohydrolase